MYFPFSVHQQQFYRRCPQINSYIQHSSFNPPFFPANMIFCYSCFQFLLFSFPCPCTVYTNIVQHLIHFRNSFSPHILISVNFHENRHGFLDTFTISSNYFKNNFLWRSTLRTCYNIDRYYNSAGRSQCASRSVSCLKDMIL